MKIENHEHDDDILRMTFEGSLDIPGSDVAERPMAHAARTRDRVILDFSNLDFLSSVGVREIVKTARVIGNRGGKVVILRPNDAARKVLAATRVDTVVAIADDEDAAVAVFTA